MVDRCLCFHVRRISRKLTQIYDQALKPVGLTSGQFVMLAILETDGPLTVGALGRRLDLEASATGRALRILEKQGLVDPLPAHDNRQHLIHISPSGLDKLDVAGKAWSTAQQQAEQVIGNEPASDLVRVADYAWQRLN